MSTQMIPITESGNTPATAPITPQAMLCMAVQNGNIELAEKIMALIERGQALSRRQAFDSAIAAASAELPVIFKNREKTGAGGTYRYEDMAQIVQTVRPILSQHGLSFRFRTDVDGDLIKVTCILFHVDGHSEENTLPGRADTTGSKNAIQAIGSAVTYLERYALKAALGLAVSADDDGAGGAADDTISPAQLAELIALADEVGADKERFCRYMRVPSLAAIPASRLTQAIAALNSKRAKP